MDFEKKLYLVPAMQIVNLKHETMLLSGGDGVESVGMDQNETPDGTILDD